jgi:hypothetical protein
MRVQTARLWVRHARLVQPLLLAGQPHVQQAPGPCCCAGWALCWPMRLLARVGGGDTCCCPPNHQLLLARRPACRAAGGRRGSRSWRGGGSDCGAMPRGEDSRAATRSGRRDQQLQPLLESALDFRAPLRAIAPSPPRSFQQHAGGDHSAAQSVQDPERFSLSPSRHDAGPEGHRPGQDQGVRPCATARSAMGNRRGAPGGVCRVEALHKGDEPLTPRAPRPQVVRGGAGLRQRC